MEAWRLCVGLVSGSAMPLAENRTLGKRSLNLLASHSLYL